MEKTDRKEPFPGPLREHARGERGVQGQEHREGTQGSSPELSPRGQCRLPPGPHRGSAGASRQGDTGSSEPLSWAGLSAETSPALAKPPPRALCLKEVREPRPREQPAFLQGGLNPKQ